MLVCVVTILLGSGCSMMSNQMKEAPVFYPTLDGKWIGLGIAYSPYRDGQGPDEGIVPSEEDVLEDLKILTANKDLAWHLIRLYGADVASEQVLHVIEKHNLPIRVMQGAWIEGKKTKTENDAEIERVISLANKYPDIIVAVNLGNEIFVDWSAHKFEVDEIPMYLEWVAKVKNETSVPVTIADDYNFFNKPWSAPVAEAVDFIVLHAYAMWNSQTLENAVEWTESIYNDISSRYPAKQIVLGESGWTTSSISSNGDERLIIAEASENAQSLFFAEYRRWLAENEIASFYFQSFDEKWKGGFDKADGIAEKNWGLYRSDRTPKKAVTDYLSD